VRYNTRAVAKPKISIVSYLNSVPLAWGILEGPQAGIFDPLLSTPAECADQLSGGRVDIGLIPSIEYQRIRGTKIIAGPAVACRHRVRSVLLVSELPLWKVRTVAADKASRTSVTLAKIIFDEFFHVRPEFQPAEPDVRNMLRQCDAAVIIGDPALKFIAEHELPDAAKQQGLLRFGPEPLQVFDLMERWKFLTGLPFVFAFWAARKDFHDQQAVDALRASRDYGVYHIPEIAGRYAEQLSMKKEFLQEYLEQNVVYHMDEACVEGLRLFYEKAARIGAIKSVRGLEFL
jgi:chorismate dehydratase